MKPRLPLPAALLLLSACANSPPGVPDPIGYETPVPGASAASAAPSAVPSAAPGAASADPVPATPGPHVGVIGAGALAGKPLARWAIALADAATGEALRVRAAAPTAVAAGTRVAFLPEGRTGSDGSFRFWIENPRPGEAVRITLTSPDEAEVVTAIAFEGDLGPLPLAGPAASGLVLPSPAATSLELTAPAAYRLAQASAAPSAKPSARTSAPPVLRADAARTVPVDAVSTAQAALLRGPLAALRLLPPAATPVLVEGLRVAAARFTKPLAAAAELKPALAATALNRAGQDGGVQAQALAAWLEAAGLADEARGLVAGAIADIAAAPVLKTAELPETPLWPTPLTVRKAAGEAAPKVRSTATGQDAEALTREALEAAAGGAAGTGPTADGSESYSLRFAAMAGDKSLTTSGPTPAIGAPTFYGFGQDGRTVRPIDFRFYVHDVVLVGPENKLAPLKLAETAWQYEDLALVDLDTGTTEAFNNTITGTAPRAAYTGVRFKVGLPADLLFADRVVGGGKRSPHPILAWDGHAASMGGTLMQGRRAMKLELAIQQDGGKEKRLAFHLGGTGASNPLGPEDARFDPEETTFAAPNVATIKLDGFNPQADTIVADVKALFTGATLGSGGEYYPVTDEPGATGGVPASEVNLPTGHQLLRNLGLASSGEQLMFRKAK